MSPEAHPTPPDRDTLLLEQDPLGDHPAHVSPKADSPAGVDDPLPGDVVGTALHRRAHRPGGAGVAQEGGELAVGRHLAPGDPSHQAIHGTIEGPGRAPIPRARHLPHWSS